MHIGVIPEASALRGLIARAEMCWISSALGLTTRWPEPYGRTGVSFQQMLGDAQKQSMTLREFEKRLARAEMP